MKAVIMTAPAKDGSTTSACRQQDTQMPEPNPAICAQQPTAPALSTAHVGKRRVSASFSDSVISPGCHGRAQRIADRRS